MKTKLTDEENRKARNIRKRKDQIRSGKRAALELKKKTAKVKRKRRESYVYAPAAN